MHYGALDAYCMIPLVEKLVENGKAVEEFNLAKLIRPESLNKQEEEKKKGDKKKRSNYKKKAPKD